MKKTRIIFRWTGNNAYTVSYLMALLTETLDPENFTIGTAETLSEIYATDSGDPYSTIVAYTLVTPQAEWAKNEILSLKKDLGQNITVICGGPHPTALPEDLLDAGADHVFTGEAEESLPRFLRLFHNSPGTVKDRIIAPLPLEHFDAYPPFAYKLDFFAPVEIRRGCANRCAFCQTPGIFPEIRERSVGYVRDTAIKILEHGRDSIFFLITDALSYGSDALNPVDPRAIEKLLSELSGTGIKIHFGNFPSEVSPSSLARYPETALIMKKYTENTKILVGGQSASDRVLGIMGRAHNADDITTSAKILRETGFTPIIDILLGVPGEEKKDRELTMSVMESLVLKYRIRVNMHYFMPLPGTPLYGSRPEPVEDSVKNRIALLVKNGHARGDFFKQLELNDYTR
ncbi:MAG: TIGR04013 family B12-binding domain/radical SAM domain-containing protein [Candidatus Omnitrophica bacterium]|nr:TIGR04013 family B12-binding domain/radical SAM domain-containing protein [Candidatus Omnitrophota bacterium]